MYFQLYEGLSETPEKRLSEEEIRLTDELKDKLTIFPINRIRIRKNFSEKSLDISIEIELDSSISSEKIYQSVIKKIITALDIDLVVLNNTKGNSNFEYFFYGETLLDKYHCSIFIDVPSEPYIPKNELPPRYL